MAFYNVCEKCGPIWIQGNIVIAKVKKAAERVLYRKDPDECRVRTVRFLLGRL